jgi:hypothetical protein
MSFSSAIRVALGALLVHKGRFALTSLGIVVGIGAVIAMVSAGNGARQKLDGRLASVGKNLILVRPGSRTESGTIADFAPLKLAGELADCGVAGVGGGRFRHFRRGGHLLRLLSRPEGIPAGSDRSTALRVSPNSKSQIKNSKQIRNSNRAQIPNFRARCFEFGISDLEFVWNFLFEISNLKI